MEFADELEHNLNIEKDDRDMIEWRYDGVKIWWSEDTMRLRYNRVKIRWGEYIIEWRYDGELDDTEDYSNLGKDGEERKTSRKDYAMRREYFRTRWLSRNIGRINIIQCADNF